jgi:hypothetical protein
VTERRGGLEDDQQPGIDSGVAETIRGDRAPEPNAPEVVAARRKRVAEAARAGSRGAPYTRKRDNVPTVKVTFVCSKKTSDKLNLYTLRLSAGWTRAAFIEAAVARAIADRIDQPDSAKKAG